MSILNTFDVSGNVNPVTEELSVDQNGVYMPSSGVDGYNPVHVNVQPALEQLNVTQNGNYSPSQGKDGFSSVSVDVQATPTVQSLSVTENGTYTAPTGVDGYNPVNVNVPDGDMEWGGSLVTKAAAGPRIIAGRYVTGFDANYGYYYPKTPLDGVPSYNMTKPFNIHIRVKVSGLMVREQAIIGDDTAIQNRPVVTLASSTASALFIAYFSTDGSTWDTTLSVSKAEMPFLADQWYEIDYSWADGTFTFKVDNGATVVTKTASTTHFTDVADSGTSRVQIGARRSQLAAQYITVDLYDTYWEQDGVLVWGNKAGGDKPDITKLPAPTGYDLWAYLLVDNAMENCPKVYSGISAGSGSVWERGHVGANNTFIVDETITQSGTTGVTLDYSAVTDRWIIYRLMPTTNNSATSTWDKQLKYMPVVDVSVYNNIAGAGTFRSYAAYIIFYHLERLFFAGILTTAPILNDNVLGLIVFDLSKVNSITSTLGGGLWIGYHQVLKTIKLPRISGVTMSSSQASMFRYCLNLKNIDLSGYDFSSVTSLSSSFRYCYNLKTLNLSGCNFSSLGASTNMDFGGCYNLTNLILDNTVWSSQNTSLDDARLLTHDSLIALIAALPTLSGITRTLTLHPDALARLSAAEIDVATQKGWTVA